MPTPDAEATLGRRLRARLGEKDDYGVVLLLILATILTLSFGSETVGKLASVCLSGFTLLYVLHTSGARQRTVRAASVVVVVAVAGAAGAQLTGASGGSDAAGLIGLLLAFAAPLVILRRILLSPTITVRLVLGALAIYLLLGLTYAYLYPLIHLLTGQSFFVQTTSPQSFDYVYFSYVTLTTVGYRGLHRRDECRTDDGGVGGAGRAGSTWSRRSLSSLATSAGRWCAGPPPTASKAMVTTPTDTRPTRGSSPALQSPDARSQRLRSERTKRNVPTIVKKEEPTVTARSRVHGNRTRASYSGLPQ